MSNWSQNSNRKWLLPFFLIKFDLFYYRESINHFLVLITNFALKLIFCTFSSKYSYSFRNKTFKTQICLLGIRPKNLTLCEQVRMFVIHFLPWFYIFFRIFNFLRRNLFARKSQRANTSNMSFLQEPSIRLLEETWENSNWVLPTGLIYASSLNSENGSIRKFV